MSRLSAPAALAGAFWLGLAAGACVSPGGSSGAGGATGVAGATGRGGAAGTAPAGTSGGAGAAGTGAAGTGQAGSTAGAAGRGGSGAAGTGSGGDGRAGSNAAAGSTGTGGSTGAAGTSGVPAIVIPGMGNCTAPAGARVEDARAAYDKWKADLVTSDGARGFLRVRRPNSSGAEVNSTVSEGIAYGMLLAVYADDQPTFDNLWQYSQQFLDANGLMHWYINAAGTQVLGMGAASDSDEDIAFALVMADARWGGRGSLSSNYLDLAKTMIGRIWQHEVDHTRNDVLKAGDQFADGSVINISYFAPAFYRVFGRVTGNTANWNRVADTSYVILARTLTAQNGNANNGLVPAWSTPEGVPMAPPGTSHPTHHQLDSCRTPFRIAQDYCWFAEPRALAYLQKINGFHQGVTVAAMVDGYNLDGSPRPQFVTSGGPRAASFVGTAGVGAMATGAAHATLRDQAYASVTTLTQLAGSIYYQTSWTGLTIQMMTGVMRDLTAP
jgi:hypothetical protein